MYFARQLVLVREMSLVNSSEPQQNFQNIKMAAKRAVTILNFAILTKFFLQRLNHDFKYFFLVIIIRILVSVNIISLLKMFSRSGKA